MPEYQLSEAADCDLTEVYQYTYAQFGVAQADAYFNSLEETLLRLASNPELGLDVSALRQKYRRFVHKRHSIFYKPARNGIFVVRVLGPGMSADRNLP